MKGIGFRRYWETEASLDSQTGKPLELFTLSSISNNFKEYRGPGPLTKERDCLIVKRAQQELNIGVLGDRVHSDRGIWEEGVIQQCFTLLGGVPSSLFRLNHQSMEFEAPPFYGIDAKLKDYVAEFVRTGTEVYRLNIFVGHFGQMTKVGGQTLQAYALAVQKELQDYQLRLLKFNQIVQHKRRLMHSILTANKEKDSTSCHFSLIQLNTYMYSSMEKIHTLAAMCLCSARKSQSWVQEREYDLDLQLQHVLNRQNWLTRFPRAMQLLSYLFYVVASRQNEAQSQALVRRLFDRACEPLFAFLYRYIYSGRVMDPCQEYFITAKPTTGNQKFKGYNLDDRVESIPAFLLKSIKNISVCGMLLNVLRQCSKHQYLALCEGRELQEEAPYLKIYHDIEGLREFEARSMKFYQNQHQRLAELQIEHERAEMFEEIQLRKALEEKMVELAEGRLSIVREKIEAKEEERKKAMEYRKALDEQVKAKEKERKEKEEEERLERERMDEELTKQRELEKIIADNMRKKLEEILNSQNLNNSQRTTRATINLQELKSVEKQN